MYAFDFVKPSTVEEAVAALAAEEEAQALGGGQTLLPTLRQRLAHPSRLVALSGIASMRGVAMRGGELCIGGGTTHATVAREAEPHYPALASLAGRVSDLIVARDLAASKASPTEIARRVARGNARMAERLVDAARRYRGEELDAMLIGLWEADVAIKSNAVDEESALAAWIGEHLLATARASR